MGVRALGAGVKWCRMEDREGGDGRRGLRRACMRGVSRRARREL